MTFYLARRGSLLSALTAGVFAWLGLGCGNWVAAQTGTPEYYRIEQDWELVVSTPDENAGTPNVVVAMSPQGSTDLFANLLINYGSAPDYFAGGLQSQLWQGSTLLAKGDFKSNLLKTVNETITFTTYLNYDVATNTLSFGAINGRSSSFGSFSTANGLVVTCMPQVPLSSALGNYSTADSINHTEIVAGVERVSSLTLKAVRKYYTKDGKGVKKGSTIVIDSEGPQQVF